MSRHPPLPASLLVLLLLVPAALADCEQLRTLRYPGEKSYEMSKAFINITVQPDGRVQVRETFTFDFQTGKFSYAYRDLAAPPGSISNVAVEEGGLGSCFDYVGGGNPRVTWYYDQPVIGQRTFTVSYTLTGVLTSYDDYTELYWKVWGSEWSVPVLDLEGVITLPGDTSPEQVYTWGHPSFKRSRVGMQGARDVVFQVFDVPANQWVEMRVAFPTSLLNSRQYAHQRAGQGLSIIQQEEAQRGLRGAASASLGTGVGVLLFLTPLFVILLSFLILYLAWGREPAVGFTLEHERDIPYDYSPAIVSALFNQASRLPGNEAFGAVIIDLVRRNYIRLERTTRKTWLSREQGYELSLTDRGKPYRHDTGLSGFEREAMRIVFGETDKTTLHDFQERMAHEHTLRIDFVRWKSLVKEDIEKRKLLGTSPAQAVFGAMLFLSVLLGIAFQFFGQGLRVAGFGCFAAAVLGALMLAVFGQALPRRTTEGALHYKRWKALKRFFDDFSQFDKVPVDAVTVWEHYLVYAIVLGEAKNVEKALRLKLESSRRKSYTMFGTSFSSASVAGFAGVAGGFSSAAATSASTRGGGFHGGGGGGGSGGGGGAG